MIASSFSKNSFLLVLAAPSSSLIYASVIFLSIYILYHIFARLAIVRCCLKVLIFPAKSYNPSKSALWIACKPFTVPTSILSISPLENNLLAFSKLFSSISFVVISCISLLTCKLLHRFIIPHFSYLHNSIFKEIILSRLGFYKRASKASCFRGFLFYLHTNRHDKKEMLPRISFFLVFTACL